MTVSPSMASIWRMKAVHVKITTPDHEVLGFELFRAGHSLFMISV